MKKFNIPGRFSAYFIFVCVNTLIFSIFRIIFFFINKPSEVLSSHDIARAFFTGLRFDLRIAFLFSLVLGIFFLFPARKWLKKLALWLYTFAFGGFVLVYFLDFGYFSYLTERLNAYVFELAANTGTSLEMVWESYPVIKGGVLLLVLMTIYYFFLKKLINWAYSKPARKKQYWFAFVALLLTAAFVHGKFSQYPLRWSDAYFTNNSFVSALGLNPMQNLFDTYKFAQKGVSFDADKTRQYYDIVADYLGVTEKDAQNLNFSRTFPGKKVASKYNIVVILMESLSFDKTSFNNPELETTPEILERSKNGTLFTRFFTPAAGTAKGVFASITGLPDTSTILTSSRNPLIVKQHTLINDLKDYKKFYFIGGSTSWGNVRGLLQSNIDGLKIFEEGTYEGVDRNDVWGLSDLDMFRYAADELGRTQQPFFALIQTSGFHRPYTIPDDHGTFQTKTLDEDLLKTYGFSGNAEYNSMRFQDYAMGEFFRLAEKEPFYKDTIFFIYGDHGLTVRDSKNSPRGIIELELTTNNTPLIVVGPGIAKTIDDKPVSQVDITASMSGLLGGEYRESALGRNVFDPNVKRGAFILASSGAPLRTGFIEDDFYYTLWPNKTGMFKYKTDNPDKDWCPEYPEKCARMKDLATGLYEAARYITFHNK